MRPRHAFVVPDPAVIEPLGTAAADTWLLDGPVRARTAALLEGAGLTVEAVATMDEALERAAATEGGGLVTLDSVVFSGAVLRGLLALAPTASRRVLTAALPEGLATRRLSHVGGLDAVTVGGQGAFTAPLHLVGPGARPGSAEPVLLPYREQTLRFPTPLGMLGRPEATFGVSDAVLVHVSHWAHVLRVNLSMFLAGWVERWHTPGGRLWYLWRALAGFPWRRGRLAASIRRVHRRAQVHHRAHVELSVVEEGAVIGANAVVKNSWIGRGARIDDGAIVNACVVGAGAFVASGAGIFSSLLCPGAFAAQQKMQFSLLGENSVAFTGSYFYDLNFERNVRVPHRGEMADAGDRFLSVCLGPWARVAGGVWIASGRSVPAGALIVQPAGRVLHKIDGELAGVRRVTVEDGKAIDAGPLPPREA